MLLQRPSSSSSAVRASSPTECGERRNFTDFIFGCKGRRELDVREPCDHAEGRWSTGKGKKVDKKEEEESRWEKTFAAYGVLHSWAETPDQQLVILRAKARSSSSDLICIRLVQQASATARPEVKLTMLDTNCQVERRSAEQSTISLTKNGKCTQLSHHWGGTV